MQLGIELDLSLLCPFKFLSVFLLEKALGLLVSARCSHFGVFPQEAGEETQLLRQPSPHTNWPTVVGPVPPWTPPQCCHAGAVLPWLFVFCFRKNTEFPVMPVVRTWHFLWPRFNCGPGTEIPAVQHSQEQACSAGQTKHCSSYEGQLSADRTL